MRLLAFEGNTWKAYEAMREKGKRITQGLVQITQGNAAIRRPFFWLWKA